MYSLEVKLSSLGKGLNWDYISKHYLAKEELYIISAASKLYGPEFMAQFCPLVKIKGLLFFQFFNSITVGKDSNLGTDLLSKLISMKP